jgi:bleomycin hydrolase
MGSAASKPQVEDLVMKSEPAVEEKPRPSPALKPASADGTISISSIADWEADAAASPKTQLARTIFSQTDISSLSRRDAKIDDAHVFNHQLAFQTGPITNQKSSGRCWLFATTNVLRYDIMKKLNLKDFQLSQVRCSLLSLHSPLMSVTELPLLLGQAEQGQLLPRTVHPRGGPSSRRPFD